MSKLLTLVLTLLLSIQLVSADQSELSDIADDEHRDSIEFLKQQGIISGYPDGTFQPKRTLNRAELLKILVAGQGITPSSVKYKSCFLDVTDEWFAPYVCYAEEKKWVAGYADGYFRPEQEVNKVEAIKMLINTQGITLAGSSTEFDDIDEGEWFAPFVAAAERKGLLEEVGYFQPSGGMTRGNISENIFRAIAIAETDSEKYSEELRAEVSQLTESVNQNTNALSKIEQRIQELEEQLANSEAEAPNTTTSPTPSPTVESPDEPVAEVAEPVASVQGMLTISDTDGNVGHSGQITPVVEIPAGEQRVSLGTYYFKADYGDVTITEIPLNLNAEVDWINAGFYLEVDDEQIKKVVVNHGYMQAITTDGVPSGKVWDYDLQTYIDHGDTAFTDEAGLFTIPAGTSKKVSLYFDNNVEYVECGLRMYPNLMPSKVLSGARSLGNSDSFWFELGRFTVNFPQDGADKKCEERGLPIWAY